MGKKGDDVDKVLALSVLDLGPSVGRGRAGRGCSPSRRPFASPKLRSERSKNFGSGVYTLKGAGLGSAL